MSHSKSRAVFHRRVAGHPWGIYVWKRLRGFNRGIVFRLGPWGHFQIQWSVFRVGRKQDRRRPRREIKVSWWGVRGRRRKRSLGFFIDK